jgi:biotin carboxyl carrier protein
VDLPVAEGDEVRAGEPIAILSAMKMEHEVAAPVAGILRRREVEIGAVVAEGRCWCSSNRCRARADRTSSR